MSTTVLSSIDLNIAVSLSLIQVTIVVAPSPPIRAEVWR